MDDTRIQQLLEQAGSEYNQGKYTEAIEHWQEVLGLDPENQKAREGIRMAKLLVVNWESSQSGGDELMLETGVDPETQQKIEFGIARVRELMAAGRHKEAMEGCQLLAELAPGQPSVLQVQEEIAHAIEVTPFIEEHLGRARKLMAAGRGDDAVEEARKVLSVDPGNAEAESLVSRAKAAGGGAPGPSAFDQEGHPAPPSPFAGSSKADELMASVDLGRHAAKGAEQGSPGETPIEMEFEEVESDAPPSGAAAGDEVGRLIEQGRGLFAQKKYQEAIEVWSRVYALDSANAEVGDLMDQANARIAEIGSRVDDALYRAQDQVEAGNLAGAKKLLEEVLSMQPGNREALDRIAKIDEQLAGPAVPDSIPVASSGPDLSAPAPQTAGAHRTESPWEGRASGAARASVPPRAATSASAGVFKKKPARPQPRSGAGRVVIALALVAVVVAGAAAAWWFLMGPQSDDTNLSLGPSTAGVPSSGPPREAPPASGAGPTGPAAPVQETGTVKPEPSPPPPPDPATVKREIADLMREGRDLLAQGSFTEAHGRFQQVLALDSTNFDAEELRLKAATGMAEETRFGRDLESARKAFEDQDWASSLYKLYRLQQEREDLAVLKQYIANANHNWGVQDLEAFRLESALEHFNDALEQDPGDPATLRHVDVARRYEKRKRDPAFDAYVSNLALRPLDAD